MLYLTRAFTFVPCIYILYIVRVFIYTCRAGHLRLFSIFLCNEKCLALHFLLYELGSFILIGLARR